MKRFHAILMTLGLALLSYLVWKVGPGELWRELSFLGWGVVPLVLGEGLAEMIHTVGWRHCLSGPHRSLPWVTLFRIRMAGYAINCLTPTAALGGEVTKGALLTSHGRGPAAASGVLIGKLCFALAHLVFVVLGGFLVLPLVRLPRHLWQAMFVCGMLVATGMFLFLVLQQQGKLGVIVRWLAAAKPVGHPLQRAAREFTAVDETIMRFYRERPQDLLLAIGWHLVGYSVGIVQTWLFFHLLHQDATWTLAAAACFLGMCFDLLTFAIPLNLGTLEGGRIVALQAIGYTVLMGMTYGLALRLAQLFWACFGLLAYALLSSRTAAAVAVDLPTCAAMQASALTLANPLPERTTAEAKMPPLNPP